MAQEVKNLDALINEISFELINSILKISDKNKRKKLLNCIEKSLGVLSNDGVYAYYVYIKSQDKKSENIFENIFLEQLSKLTEIVKVYEEDKDINNKKQIIELNQKYFEKLSENLPSLLFFRDVLEEILTYARYHAKALGD